MILARRSHHLPRHLRRLAVVVMGAAVLLASCDRPRPWNVLVVTLDTTRADFLGCYGRTSASTPNFDRLAAEGFLFQHAMSAAPVTLPSHSTIFTGTYPPVHGVRDNGLFALPEESTTLAEILKARGYATAAAIGSFPLTRQFGLAQGFDLYDDQISAAAEDREGMRVQPKGNLYFDERSAVQVNDAILPWLREHLDRPFFAWIHYWDPHHPHIPPPPFNQLYQHELYEGEIAFVDQSFGVVLRTLEEAGVADRTLIVVVGDHGEGRGEHYEDTHSQLAYDSTLHVPLILRVPGMEAGRQIARRVGTVDIVPTLLDLLAIEERPAEIQGRSLAPLLRARAENDASSGRSILYAEALSPRLSNGWGELRAFYKDDLKYIHGPRPELFDLGEDPGETRNRLADLPGEAQSLRQDLATFLRHQPQTLAAKAIKGDDAEVRARLAALGYLSASGDSPEAITEELHEGGIAPQDRVRDNSLSSYAKQQISAGEFLLARESARELVERDPANAFYRGLLAMSLLGLGQPESAAEVIEDAASTVSQNDEIFLQVARELFDGGKRDRGLAILERLLAERDGVRGRYLLAEMYSELGDRAAYERELRAALAVDATHAPSRLSLAILLAQGGNRAAAAEIFVSLLRDFPLNARYHFNYALVLLDPTDPSRQAAAITHLERAVELNPTYWKPELQLIALRLERGERQEAERRFESLETRCRDAAVLREARAMMARITTEPVS